MENLYCIGDSHVSVFLGKDGLAPLFPLKAKSLIPRIKVARLEGILAYNLPEYKRTTLGREKLEEELQSNVPVGSWILISAGEVDCRVHLIRQAQKQNRSFEQVSAELSRRYIGFLSTLKKDYRVCILLPPPTSFLGEDQLDDQYPRFGSERQRNQMTLSLNAALKHECFLHKIPAIGATDTIITRDYKTVKRFLWDGVHYSTAALPSLLSQVNKHTDLQLALPISWRCKEFLRKVKNIKAHVN